MYKVIGGDGKEYGPFSAQQLQQWLAEGRINPHTQVQAEGQAVWQPLSAFPELLPRSPASGPPVPPPLVQPPPLPVKQRLEDDPTLRMLVPVGRSALSIIAGYLGLCSVLLIPAPLALIIGIWAIYDIKKSRQTSTPKYGMGRAIFGTVMGGLFTIFLCIFFITRITG